MKKSIETFCKIDFKYLFVLECMQLVKTSLNISKARYLAVKLRQKFISCMTNNYDHEIRNDFIHFKMCYHALLKNDHLKIKIIVEKHLDTFEIVFAPVQELLDETKFEKCMCVSACNIRGYCDCTHYRCCSKQTVLFHILQMYHALKLLKYFYLLQKCIKNKKHYIDIDKTKNVYSKFRKEGMPLEIISIW